MTEFLFILLGFLLGSFPTGYLVGRFFGIDIRTEAGGSGNIGATNLGRCLERHGVKSAGLWQWFVTMIDAAKGFVPVFWYLNIVNGSVWNPTGYMWVGAVAIAPLFGHNHSVFLHFKGGKGVATSLGVISALVWQVGLVGFIFWLALKLMLKKLAPQNKQRVAISSVSAVWLAFLLILLGGIYDYWPTLYLVVALAIATIVSIRHIPNFTVSKIT